MIRISLLLLIGSLFGYASEPEVIITTKSSTNGYGMVAGRVVAPQKSLVGVSLDNGGVRYSTVADPSGTWAIVFRHTAVNFVVKAWTVGGTEWESSLEGKLALEAADSLDRLPWTETVSANETAPSEYSARYQTERSLRWRIDQLRYRCDGDKGRFDYSLWQPTCYKTGSSYRCSGTATCYCRAR